MITKTLEEQLLEYQANRRLEKQRKIERAVVVADRTITALQVIVGTLIAIYVVHYIEYYQRPAAVREAAR